MSFSVPLSKCQESTKVLKEETTTDKEQQPQPAHSTTGDPEHQKEPELLVNYSTFMSMPDLQKLQIQIQNHKGRKAVKRTTVRIAGG